MQRLREWLPVMVLFIIPIVFLILHALGYQVYVMDGEKYPWIINTDKIIGTDSTNHSYVELLTSLEQKGLVLSPQEFTNNTYNFFSWLLTILVTVISIVVIFFGINIDKKIESSVDNQLKQKWLELMRVDKEVDSTIGGIIDDKVEEAMSDNLQRIDDRLKKIEQEDVKFNL